MTPSSARAPGPSVRLKLTLSYVGFLMVAGALLLVVVYVFLLRYVPDEVNTWVRTAPTAATSSAPSSRGLYRRSPSCWSSGSSAAGSSPAGCSRR